MAVILEDISIIVPLDLLEFERNADSGFRAPTAWHDDKLYCERVATAMEVGLRVEEWARRGFMVFDPGSLDAHWRNLCLASAGLGPHGTCGWLEYDPVTDAVWRKGDVSGEAFGGWKQYQHLGQQLAALRVSAEEAYSRMYVASHPKDERDDALSYLAQAMKTAQLLNNQDALAELKVRHEHINAVFRSQFSF